MGSLSLEAARRVVDAAIGTICTACVLLVEHRGQRATLAAGTLCPDPERGPDAPCTETSIFDLASLTKLATTALCLALVRDRVIQLDMPLREIVPDFRGGKKDEVTIANVLTHTAGLLWWKPFYKEAKGIDETVWLAAQEPLAHDLGTFVYSDLGYIMLTGGLANAGGGTFAELIRERVLGPIGAETCTFGPRPQEECAATELDEVWRRKRLRGEVDDENAYAMGGTSGQAGLFGTAADVAALARVYRDGAVIGNDLAALARGEHVRAGTVRRGLGLALRATEAPMVGRHFSEDAWGHTGFVGTTIWVDPAVDLTVVLLTNCVYFGRANNEEVYRLRVAVHEAVSAPA